MGDQFSSKTVIPILNRRSCCGEYEAANGTVLTVPFPVSALVPLEPVNQSVSCKDASDEVNEQTRPVGILAPEPSLSSLRSIDLLPAHWRNTVWGKRKDLNAKSRSIARQSTVFQNHLGRHWANDGISKRGEPRA